MMETENGLLVRAEIAGIKLFRSVGHDVLLFHPEHPGVGNGVLLKARDCKQLAHALLCAYYPYVES